MNENTINEMKQAVNNLVEMVNNEFGGHLIFKLNKMGADKCNTSYLADINAFGFELQIVYDYEADKIYLFDVESGNDILVADMNNGGDVDELCLGAYHYAMMLHAADSTNGFEVL